MSRSAQPTADMLDVGFEFDGAIEPSAQHNISDEHCDSETLIAHYPMLTNAIGWCILLQDDDEDANEPLDMSWPDTGRKRITYMLVAPILFPLWLTLPDTRTPKGRQPIQLKLWLIH